MFNEEPATAANSLSPPFQKMMRLFEDDVTPDNVESHLADYDAFLSELFTPAQLEFLKPTHERFYQAVREFAAYDIGREPA